MADEWWCGDCGAISYECHCDYPDRLYDDEESQPNERAIGRADDPSLEAHFAASEASE